MESLTSAARVRAALDHQEPDRVPLDFGGAEVAGINIHTMRRMREHLGLGGEVEMDDKIIQTGKMGDDLIERLGVDVKIVPPNDPSDPGLERELGLQDGHYRYIDEFGIGWQMPETGGHYYDLYRHPFAGVDTVKEVEDYPWPDMLDAARFVGMKEHARSVAREEEKAVLLGHSMGSYIAQYFSMQHDYRLTALVLSASTWPKKIQLIPGRLIARFVTMRHGIRGKSELLHKLGFGAFNKSFEPSRTELDWLSRDTAEVDAYVSDPLCGGPYSCGLWLDLLGGLQAIASDRALRRIRKDLPVLFTGGADDPVGGQKGITNLVMHYAKSGHSSLSTKIYPDGRHEMFNETNRDEFTADVLDWIEEQLPGVAGT